MAGGRPQRLRRTADFDRAYREGKTRSCKLFRIHYADGEPDCTRVAYVASRRTGTAVSRNRAKRMLREASRDVMRHAAQGHDVVFVAHPALLSASARDTRAAAERLLKNAGITGGRG